MAPAPAGRGRGDYGTSEMVAREQDHSGPVLLCASARELASLQLSRSAMQHSLSLVRKLSAWCHDRLVHTEAAKSTIAHTERLPLKDSVEL
jgi:hypothetical protein